MKEDQSNSYNVYTHIIVIFNNNIHILFYDLK